MNIIKNGIFTIFLFFVIEISSSDIKKVTYAAWDKPDVELYYKLPNEINNNTKLIFVIHGASRDVKRYLEAWLEQSKDKNVILVAPFFSKDSFQYYNTLGLASSSGKTFKNSKTKLTNSISSFFTFFKSKYDLKTETYRIFGFSGGSQFVHRYMMYGTDERVELAAIGSAGWYTFLNNEPFPFGITNMPVDKNRLDWFLSKEVLFIVGKNDNDPNHSSLNSNYGAKKQGAHRHQRGESYFNNLINYAEINGMPFRWRFRSVEGLDHNIEEMTKNAAPFLLSGLEY
tara:strand:+ start:640 stop:1494 length:855 start_codon:yes stop_codon:yes gene_type:complete